MEKPTCATFRPTFLPPHRRRRVLLLTLTPFRQTSVSDARHQDSTPNGFAMTMDPSTSHRSSCEDPHPVNRAFPPRRKLQRDAETPARRVWAISDLHLAQAGGGNRDYESRRPDHLKRIGDQWRAVVQPSDLVLLPGDVSMAKTHREVQPDLRWLAGLPGRKVLSPGNHDRWFSSAAAIKSMLRTDQWAVHATAVQVGGVIVCGARSAPVPPEDPSDPSNWSAVTCRRLAELETALEQAQRLRGDHPDAPIVALWHHPPFDLHRRPGPWVEAMERAGIDWCLYGHLHTEGQWQAAPGGRIGTIRYACVAADALGFRPLKLWDWETTRPHPNPAPAQ